MVKHVREMIHRVGSFDRFRKIVKRAITTDSSGKSLEKLKTMHGARDIRTGDQTTTASQIVAPIAQPDRMISLQNMVKQMKDDVEKKILGKDPETNIFVALSQSKENIGGAIAQSNEDNKEYFASIMQMFQGLEVAINDIESQKK